MSHDLTNWDESSIRVVMAGTGNPYHYLTPFRKQLIWAIHHDGRKSVLVRQFDISIEKLENETAPLIQATLVQEETANMKLFFLLQMKLKRQLWLCMLSKWVFCWLIIVNGVGRDFNRFMLSLGWR
jgi:hypothetical protein